MWRIHHTVIVAAIVFAGSLLAACSSTPAQPPTQVLQFDSIPPGATVQTAQGQACRTPCAMTVPVVAAPVTFSLTGYQDQQIPLSVREPEHSFFNTKPPFLLPNPVTAALQPLPPPPPKGKRAKMSEAPKAVPPAEPPPELRHAPEPERYTPPPAPRPWNAPSDSSPFPR
ncbi:MAG TPA: hypothetical protein VH206_00600 [Xanthobacteraceae bacterium]|jgi:hypothetical protein|nr:hypothetical protein [Xanthobacteraceae bacterium]